MFRASIILFHAPCLPTGIYTILKSMECPSMLTIDLINSEALSLLRDMERLNLIRINPLEKPVPAPESAEAALRSPMRIGFLRNRVSVPADFDTMGQEEITTLFAGNP
jgi:hypothetical protein